MNTEKRKRLESAICGNCNQPLSAHSTIDDACDDVESYFELSYKSYSFDEECKNCKHQWGAHLLDACPNGGKSKFEPIPIITAPEVPPQLPTEKISHQTGIQFHYNSKTNIITKIIALKNKDLPPEYINSTRHCCLSLYEDMLNIWHDHIYYQINVGDNIEEARVYHDILLACGKNLHDINKKLKEGETLIFRI